MKRHFCISARWLKLQFAKADKDRSGALNFEECCQVLQLLNISVDPAEARKMFDVRFADRSADESC